MKRLFAILVMMVVGVSAATAQRYYDDRHFYDEDFDWHWDVRVRISEGEQSGLLTNWEANRLYRKLERIEEKEYAYMADGNYDRWEQNDIWDDVVWLNRKVGMELYDYDRKFYGFGNVYVGFNTYPFWYNRWYVGGWDFYRYDRLGWGSWRYGYVPRYYVPTYNVFVNTNRLRNYYNHHQVTYHHTNEPIRDRNYNRNNDAVVRRDRTDPANRVNNSSRRSSTYASPNSRSYSGNSSARSRSSASSRVYTPRSNDSYGSSRNGSSSAGSSSSRSRSAAASPSRSSSSRSYEGTRSSSSSSNRSSSATRPSSSSRSSSSSTMRSSSPSQSRSSSVRPSSPSRSSSRSSATMRSSSPSRSSSATRSSGSSSRSSSSSSRGSSRSSRN